MPGLFSHISGKQGSIKIPMLGATIGLMANWQLKRRGDSGPNEGSYDLRAALTYINPVLFNHPEYIANREIRLKVDRTEYLLTIKGSAALDDHTLTADGVVLTRLH